MKNYKRLAKKLFERINLVRENPSMIINDLKEMSGKFDGNVYDGYLRTHEGVQAVLEAIDFLKNQEPVPRIKLHDGLQKVAEDFATELGETGKCTHKDKNGQGAAARISGAIDWAGSLSECLSLGSETPEDIVNWWIIDDGTPSRGHRKNLFATTSKFGGAGCASHPRYKVAAILDLVEEIEDEPAPVEYARHSKARISDRPRERQKDTEETELIGKPVEEPRERTRERRRETPRTSAKPTEVKGSNNLAEDVLNQINYVRANPQKLVPVFTEMSKKFKGNLYNDILRTNEGVSAVLEALEFVKKQSPLPPVKRHEKLMKVAQDYADEMSQTGGFSHTDKYGKSPFERIAKVIKVNGAQSECLALGSETAEDIVNSWIVDDGTKSRGHRKNIFATTTKMGGVGCATHPKLRYVAVFDSIEAEI